MRKNAWVIILGLLLFSMTFSSSFTFNVSSQPDEVDYYQLCIDFIQANYPNDTIEQLSPYIDGPDGETGFTYTVVYADLMPGTTPLGDPITVSIRHDTLNIEFGRDQIIRDWDEYYEELPGYYKIISSDARKSMVRNFGYLPTPSDPMLKNYSANPFFYCNPNNQTLLINKIKSMGGTPTFDYQGYEKENNIVIANLTLENILILANESYVGRISFIYIYDYVPSSGTPFPSSILILSIASLLAVIFRVVRLRRKKI